MFSYWFWGSCFLGSFFGGFVYFVLFVRAVCIFVVVFLPVICNVIDGQWIQYGLVVFFLLFIFGFLEVIYKASIKYTLVV